MRSKWSQHIKAKKKSAIIEVQLAVTDHDRDSVPFSMILLTCSLSTRHEGQIIPLEKCMQILNNVAVTSKHTLVVLRVLKVKLCRTILKVHISTALTRNNSCKNIELKYRGSFFQELCFAAIFYWPLYFCMQEMYNLTFVYLKNFVLLYFWIPDSVSWFSLSGFRFPGFRVALVVTLLLWPSIIASL